MKNKATGRKMPVNGTPAFVVRFGEVDLRQTLSHFATCPHAQEWRQRVRSHRHPHPADHQRGHT